MDEEPRYDDHRRRLFKIYCNLCGEIAWKRAGMRFCSKSCAVTRQHEEQPKAAPSGQQHYAWKGEDASYGAMHLRVARSRGAADFCSNRETAGCLSRKYEWAHVHGTEPGDPGNYIPLCKSCHITYDGQDGSGHSNAKLAMEQVRDIRRRYATGQESQQGLAAGFSVSQGVISNIVLGKTYRET